jgi:hypothetical protein
MDVYVCSEDVWGDVMCGICCQPAIEANRTRCGHLFCGMCLKAHFCTGILICVLFSYFYSSLFLVCCVGSDSFCIFCLGCVFDVLIGRKQCPTCGATDVWKFNCFVFIDIRYVDIEEVKTFLIFFSSQ